MGAEGTECEGAWRAIVPGFRYIDTSFEKTGKHIPPKYTGRFNGTLIYASPNIVKGIESSRRGESEKEKWDNDWSCGRYDVSWSAKDWSSNNSGFSDTSTLIIFVRDSNREKSNAVDSLVSLFLERSNVWSVKQLFKESDSLA